MIEPLGETTPVVSAADYNPLRPEVRADPYPYYAALRRESPVHQIGQGLPMLAVSRYADVRHVLHHPDIFSSAAIQSLLQGGVDLGPNSGALTGHRILESPMMIAVDPPDHARLRRLVNRGFTPRRIAALESRLRMIFGELLNRVVRDGRMDLMRDLAVPFPVMVIAELLGVEPARHAQFKAWSDSTVLGLSGGGGEFSAADVRRGADEMGAYIDEIVAARRQRPHEDLISVLVGAEDGEALSTSEVLSFIVLLLIAGNETTTNLIGNAMKALLQSPDQLGEVIAAPALIPQMLEEAVRFESPIQGLPRHATQDTAIAGTPIPKDSMLMVLFGSANRDEAQVTDADRFDIHRGVEEHLAFGHGVHFCLGAALARLEARVAFEGLFERCREFRLVGNEVPMIDSLVLRGPDSLPLEFESL